MFAAFVVATTRRAIKALSFQRLNILKKSATTGLRIARFGESAVCARVCASPMPRSRIRSQTKAEMQ